MGWSIYLPHVTLSILLKWSRRSPNNIIYSKIKYNNKAKSYYQGHKNLMQKFESSLRTMYFYSSLDWLLSSLIMYTLLSPKPLYSNFKNLNTFIWWHGGIEDIYRLITTNRKILSLNYKNILIINIQIIWIDFIVKFNPIVTVIELNQLMELYNVTIK